MGIIIDNAVTLHNRRAELAHFFSMGGGPVHANTAKQSNISIIHTGFFQFMKEGRNKQMIGAGTGDIGEDYANFLTWMRQFTQRQAPKRLVESILDGCMNIRDGRDQAGNDSISLHAGRKAEIHKRTTIGNAERIIHNETQKKTNRNEDGLFH